MKKILTLLYYLVFIIVIAAAVYTVVASGFTLDTILTWFESEWFKDLLNSLIYHFAIIGIFLIARRIGLSFINKTKQKEKHKKNLAVFALFSSFINYATAILIILVIGSLMGINVTALIASAGILGLVIGLGAQSLIADIIAGIFLVFEKSFTVGDVIVIDGFKGTVQEIGVRTTRLMDIGGDILSVNNSTILKSINTSNTLSVAKCTVQVEYEESIERVEEVITSNLDSIKKSIPAITGDLTYLGVQSLGTSGVELLITAQCKEESRVPVSRELNKQILVLFKKEGITIPFKQIVVNQKGE